MDIVIAIMGVVTLLCGVMATTLRAEAVEILRARKIAHKFDNPNAFQLADGLAWELFRMDATEFSARERRIFRLYFPVCLALIGLLAVTVVLAFSFGSSRAP